MQASSDARRGFQCQDAGDSSSEWQSVKLRPAHSEIERFDIWSRIAVTFTLWEGNKCLV